MNIGKVTPTPALGLDESVLSTNTSLLIRPKPAVKLILGKRVASASLTLNLAASTLAAAATMSGRLSSKSDGTPVLMADGFLGKLALFSGVPAGYRPTKTSRVLRFCWLAFFKLKANSLACARLISALRISCLDDAPIFSRCFTCSRIFS